MELGALVCTRLSPNCAACPVRRLCVAHREGRQERLPTRVKRAGVMPRNFLAFVVERRGRFLVRQRPPGGVNAQFWEFPNVEVKTGDDRACRPSARRWLRNQQLRGVHRDASRQTAGFHLISTKPFCIIKHSITRYRITLEAWRAELAPPAAKTPGRWLTLKQLRQLPFVSAHKKILARLRDGR
jgi:A/G-specific adenine glycosylase